MIRHVVLMTFKDGTTPADVKGIALALDTCAANLDYIVAMRHGANIEFPTPSKKADYAVVVDFASAEDCLRYDTDPEHDAIRDVTKQHVASALVTNFEFADEG
jgi:Stress responsive A/B Barrel Domain